MMNKLNSIKAMEEVLSTTEVTCDRCGSYGHKRRQCTKPIRSTTTDYISIDTNEPVMRTTTVTDGGSIGRERNNRNQRSSSSSSSSNHSNR
jgi:hypothetical protein